MFSLNPSDANFLGGTTGQNIIQGITVLGVAYLLWKAHKKG